MLPAHRRRSETTAGTATRAQAIDAEVITEAGGGRRSLGFGIVTFPSQNQLERALADMNGFEVEDSGKDRQIGTTSLSYGLDCCCRR